MAGDYHAAFQELWNSKAPAHWPRLRTMDNQRIRRANGLAKQFGGTAQALEALAASLQQAHQEDWCMKAAMRLSLENWLSNNKVGQYSEKAQSASEPASAGLSGEQREITALAMEHPQLFTGVTVADGVLRLHYSAMVQQRTGYPEQGMVNTVAALAAEISHLQAVLKTQGPVATPF